MVIAKIQVCISRFLKHFFRYFFFSIKKEEQNFTYLYNILIFIFIEYGSEYRATKAKGDMKRKGKPDPYAYVPLQKSALNRRKKAKFEGQFRGLVKAAEKGSSKGKKSKAKSLSNKMKHMKMK